MYILVLFCIITKLFTSKFIPEMAWFWRCCQTYGFSCRLQRNNVIFWTTWYSSSKIEYAYYRSYAYFIYEEYVYVKCKKNVFNVSYER